MKNRERQRRKIKRKNKNRKKEEIQEGNKGEDESGYKLKIKKSMPV